MKEIVQVSDASTATGPNYMMNARYTDEPTAINPTTAAAMDNMDSIWPNWAPAEGAERAGALPAPAARGAPVAEVGAAAARGAEADPGADAGLGAVAGAAPGLLPAAPGPPGGNVGNLIVGAAEGLGGSVMRTVSFFG